MVSITTRFIQPSFRTTRSIALRWISTQENTSPHLRTSSNAFQPSKNVHIQHQSKNLRHASPINRAHPYHITLAAAALSSLGFVTFNKSCSSAARADLPDVTLYQYAPCPYCNKVMASLDYLKIPYTAIEVNPITKKETKEVAPEYKKVPVVTIDGAVSTESAEIVRELWNRVQASSNLGNVMSREEEDEWMKWIDTSLVILTPPNIYRTLPESLQAFDYCLTEGNFTKLERHVSKYAGAVIMYFVAKKMKTKYNIPDTKERQMLYDVFEKVVTTMQNRENIAEREYLGGESPNIVDVTIFGVLRSVRTLNTFDDIMANVPNLQPWYNRMVVQVGTSMRKV